MNEDTKLTAWQRLRTRAHLLVTALIKRMTVGVRAVLLDGRKVLLVRHTYTPGWQFPGGGVEPGETAEESAAREVQEETGFTVTGPMELFGLYHNVNPATNRDHVAVYICRDFTAAPTFQRSREIAAGQWFEVDNLPDDVSPATRARLSEIFSSAARRLVWGGF